MDSELSRLPYWDKLTDEEKLTIERRSVIKHYEAGQMLHGGADGCLGMILVLLGSVRAYILSEEGREITLFRLYEGDPCVLSASCVMSQITFETQIVAEAPCKLLIVGSGDFEKLTRHNLYVRCFMYELMMNRFSSVMWTMQQIIFLGYDRRLASFLIEEYDRTGSPEIRLTHDQIAQYTSSAREVVARMLKRFAADGLVESRRGCTRLKDIEGLRALM